MHRKIVSIFLILFIGIFSLIVPANAQNTDSIKFYQFYEGIEIAKSTGKPLVINPYNNVSQGDPFEKTKAEMNKFINIDIQDGSLGSDVARSILFRGKQGPAQILILDSNGKEIARITRIGSNSTTTLGFLIRLDSDGKEIGRLPIERKEYNEADQKELLNKFDDFYSETYRYAEPKKGKIQRLPQEIGLISIAEYNKNKGEYIYDYVTISGFIRDIKYERNTYTFGIDDGTGVLELIFGGGLGDINEGDKVFVKIILDRVLSVSKNQIPSSVNTAKSDGAESSTKTPGFEVVIGVAAVLFAWRKIISK